MAAGPAHPSFRPTGPHSRLCGTPQGVRLFGIRAACLRHASEYLLVGRAPRCEYGPDPGHPRLSGCQSGLRGPGQAGPLPQQRTRALKSGGEDQYTGDLLRAPARPGRQPGLARLGEERISALIDWPDPVILYGLLRHRITYVRLLRRKASSPRAKRADRDGYRYSVQLALEGIPYQKPKHPTLEGTVGLDLGPSTIAIVPQQGEVRLGLFCAALAPRIATKRRLQRKLDRQHRATNPQNYDEQGRCKKGPKTW